MARLHELVTGHVYRSAACWHHLHDRCDDACPFCRAPCHCDCHGPTRRDIFGGSPGFTRGGGSITPPAAAATE